MLLLTADDLGRFAKYFFFVALEGSFALADWDGFGLLSNGALESF